MKIPENQETSAVLASPLEALEDQGDWGFEIYPP